MKRLSTPRPDGRYADRFALRARSLGGRYAASRQLKRQLIWQFPRASKAKRPESEAPRERAVASAQRYPPIVSR